MACPTDVAIAITLKGSHKTVTVNLIDILSAISQDLEVKPDFYDVEDVVNDVIQRMGKLYTKEE